MTDSKLSKQTQLKLEAPSVETYRIEKAQYNNYAAIKLLKAYLLKSSVTYMNCLSVENDRYFIYDQQRNILRNAHKVYFIKTIKDSKAKILCNKFVTIAVIHRVINADGTSKLVAEEQGFFSFFGDVKNVCNMVTELTNLQKTCSDFVSANVKDLTALTIDIVSMVLKLLSPDTIRLASLTTYLLDLISMCMRVSSLKDKFQAVSVQAFDVSLETIAWVLAGVGLPSVLSNRIKEFNNLTGKRVFDSSGITSTVFEVLDIFLCVLKWLSEHVDPLGILKYLYKIISSKLTFVTNFGLMKSVNNLHFKWAKNSQVMLEPSFRQEVLILSEKILNTPSFLEFIMDDKRRMNKAVYDAFMKNIVKFVKCFDTAVRLEPACVIFEGHPGCGKSVLLGNLTKVLSSNKVNMSIFSHIIPDINAAKDFYDDYENQDVMVVDDIGQQGVSQWRSIINMVSNIKMGLDCAAAEKKNTKFFTSKLIVGTTNNCSSIQGLSKQDGISDIGALFRRIHNVRCSRRLNDDGVYEYSMAYFKYDEEAGMWKNTFLPKWSETAENLHIPTSITSTDSRDTVAWALSVIKMAMVVNESTLATTMIDSEQTDELADFYNNLGVREQMMQEEDIFCADDAFKAEEVVFEQHNSFWKQICREYYDYVKEFFKTTASKLMSVAMKLLAKTSSFITGKPTKEDPTEPSWKSIFVQEFDGIIFEAPVVTEQCVGCESKVLAVITLLMSISIFGGLSLMVYKPLKRLFTRQDPKKTFAQLSKSPVFVQGQDETNRCMMVNEAPNCVRFMQMRRKMDDGTNIALGHCIVSGNRMLTNAHYYGEEMTLSLSRNWDTLQRNIYEFENIPVKLLKIDMQFDWMVLEMPGIARYPLAKSLFHTEAQFSKLLKSAAYFVNPMKSILINDHTLNRQTTGTLAIKSKYKQFEKDVPLENLLMYGITADGLCGCPIINGRGQFIGMHCAGTDEFGVAMLFGKIDLELITKLMRLDNANEKPFRAIRKDLSDDQAGIRLESTGLQTSRPLSDTSLIPSGIEMGDYHDELEDYGIKMPPEFVDESGKTRLKAMAMKSFARTADNIDHQDIAFAEKVICDMLPESFGDLTMEETAFGNDKVPSLNKDSVNGYGYKSQDKRDYFDFENKVIKDNFLEIYKEFENQCLDDKVDIEMLLAKEVFKDELRPCEKVKKPRSFRVMPLHHIFATKLCLAKMMNHITENRWENGICIGFNPYVDFDKLYNRLAPLNCFDGDFGNWDGGCNPLIQDLVNKCVRSRYTGSNGKMLDVILESIVRTPVIVKEELYVTTHSMPTGAWVTALFNSLINRALTAILYSSECRKINKPTSVVEFRTIKDFVLGDDKIVGVPNKLKNIVNAYTMKDLAVSLNMRYTDGTKGEIQSEFKPIRDCVFLKRNFRYHSELEKFVGALSMQTIMNTVLWYDSRKDFTEVMNGKCTIVQFECYLHERTGFVRHLFDEYDRLNLSYQKFSKPQIKRSMIEDKSLYQHLMKSADKDFNY